MTKPMLIEALKPGMRANVRVSNDDYDPVVHVDGFIKWELTWKDCDVETLKSVDYEIIPDEPKPWEPTESDMGYTMCRDFDNVIPCEIVYAGATKTKQAAEHKAKLDRINTAILNMPGACEGSGAVVYFNITQQKFMPTREPLGSVFDVPFDIEENAKAAADYANKLMEASHA